MRENYTREEKIPTGITPESGIHCEGGPYIFQQWLGNKTLDLISPWAQVMRCIDDRECVANKSLLHFSRNPHVGAATVNIRAYNHTECHKRS